MIEVFHITPFPPLLNLITDPRRLDTLRKSLDGTLCVLAWREGEEPEGVEVLTHEEALAITRGPEWTAPDV